MLSFQIINEGRGIQIDCDEQGMATVIGALEKFDLLVDTCISELPRMADVSLVNKPRGEKKPSGKSSSRGLATDPSRCLPHDPSLRFSFCCPS